MAKGRTLTQADVDLLKKSFSTKADLKGLVGNITSEVNKLLVAQDIRNWGKMDKLEEKFESKLTEFKSEFFEKVDPILKEVTTARDERSLIVDRVEKLEKIHPQGKHSATY